MRALLFHIDGKLPNLALMRLSAFHKERGDTVLLRRQAPDPMNLYVDAAEVVYASVIFEKSREKSSRVQEVYPSAIIGGTGVPSSLTLEALGITTNALDYAIYPDFPHSLGFTQRGCRYKCAFCVVPKKEGAVKPVSLLNDIWRGDPHPKELLLLDNDFFGQSNWRELVREAVDGHFAVCLCQGINVRTLTDEQAEALAVMDMRSLKFNTKRIYTAWDHPGDEMRVLAGLEKLKRYGVKLDNVMAYVLIGYWPGETVKDWEYRRAKLRAHGVRPYPMPFVRNKQTIGFQRWVVGAYDKTIPWPEWEAANYEPRQLQRRA